MTVVARVERLSKRYRIAKGGTAISSMLPARLRSASSKRVTKDMWAGVTGPTGAGSGRCGT